MSDTLMQDLKQRMEGAISATQREFAGLRTGRANPELLSPVTVEAYGSPMPLAQVGTVSVSGNRALTVQVWDKGLVAATEKAIRDADLGLNPMSDGDVIRINLPELNEERRKELIKVAKKYAENGRVAVRNVRRDGMDSVKKMQKDGEISTDEERSMGEEIQKLTDLHVKKVDEALEHKEKDIMTV